MRKVILIKHAKPLVQENVPSHDWSLSEDGRAKALLLAERLRPLAPGLVISSKEPKALQTAQILAQALGLSPKASQGLAEHDRSNVPMMSSPEFISLMALFLRVAN